MLNTVARTLRLSDEDNVVVATERTEPGATVADGITARQRIPFGHKVAIRPIAQGDAVVKFGQIIGFASQPIAPGDWVHEHNCYMGPEHGAFERDYLVRILKITGGNVTKAARLAGRNRTEFYRLLERHSLEPGMFKPA